MTFAERVYDSIKKIPCGKVATYKEIATFLGSPNSARAVGNALHKNPLPIVQPCHRVVNSKGELAKHFGFGGMNKQKQLLKSEGVEIKNNKVDLNKYLFSFKVDK